MGIFQRARFTGVGRRHRVPPAGLQTPHRAGPASGVRGLRGHDVRRATGPRLWPGRSI